MQQKSVVRIDSLSKDFILPHERKNTIKERILFFGKASYEHQHALRDVSVDIQKGEFFGIVGRNGSGKSTLLKIIGGIYQPTKGSVEIHGTLTPFIELGIGFNPELTGKENVYLNGAILGLTHKEIEERYAEIVDFAELEKFMDQKLKNYSSGMQVRLAFSIAIQAHNDILLIDEVLAVGDASFQRKCFEVFRQIKKSGKTVIFVTHDMGAVQEFCDRAMMIQDSRVVAIGEPREIALRYEIANAPNAKSEPASTMTRPDDPPIKILDLKLLNNGKTAKRFSIHDDIAAEITVDVKESQPVQMNFFVLKSDGTYLAGVNSTKALGDDYSPKKGQQTFRCILEKGQLVKGEYSVGVGIYTPGYVPEIIDILDKNYSNKPQELIIVDKSLNKDGTFYLQGDWQKTAK